MPSNFSFDVVSQTDMQEVENAVNQTIKEIGQRYDFKGSKTEIVIEKSEIVISSEDEFRLQAVIEILKSKFIKRNVSVRNMEFGKIEDARLGSVRQHIKISNGISMEKAKDIIQSIKGSKFKVQAQIMEDQLRVSSKDKDELQKVMSLLKSNDYGVDLNFTNYR